jgi:hypothetical protein
LGELTERNLARVRSRRRDQRSPISVPDAETIIASARRSEAEFTYLVPGNARPVLVLNKPPVAHHQEVTGLRVLRFSALGAAEQQPSTRAPTSEPWRSRRAALAPTGRCRPATGPTASAR